MNQFQSVPGPSQDDFNTLSEQMANKMGSLKAIHFFKASSALPVGNTATYQISGISDYTKCYVMSAGLHISGTTYNNAVEVLTTTSSGIQCKNNGGAGGDVMLCVFEST